MKRYNNNYMVNFNIANSDGPLVLNTLPSDHTFVVNSRLMDMLKMRGLFAGCASDYPHAHIVKIKVVSKICVD